MTSNDLRPSPGFSPLLHDKIWEWPGDEAYVAGLHGDMAFGAVTNSHFVSVSSQASPCFLSLNPLLFLLTSSSGKLGGARELDWFFARLTCSTTTLYEPQFSFFFWKKHLVLQNDFDRLLESHTTVCPSQWSLHRYLSLMNQCSTNEAPLHSCSMEVCTRKSKNEHNFRIQWMCNWKMVSLDRARR